MSRSRSVHEWRLALAWLLPVAMLLIGAGPEQEATSSPIAEAGKGIGQPEAAFGSGAGSEASVFRINMPIDESVERVNLPGPQAGLTKGDAKAEVSATPLPPKPGLASPTGPAAAFEPKDALRTFQPYLLFGLISLAPAAILMVTAFVRINIVLLLLRQALGSPQVPGNQVLTALALLLTALVMRPVGEKVYAEAVVPYTSGRATAAQAWAAGSRPIKIFMVDQIVLTKHQDHLWSLYHHAVPPGPSRHEPVNGEDFRAEDFPLRVVAPAYLLSEITTALVMGFYLYLPFLAIDLVVSAVLAAMGLFMLPPTLVAMPVKLIVFVLADGWMLVASMLLSSFGSGSS